MSPTSPSAPSLPLCPKCGAAVSGEAAQGLCPKCLFAGLADPTDDGARVTMHLPPPSPEELAPHFPQLEILECLGRGGMGVVYKARQKSLNRLVALKLLAPERAGDAGFAERFAKEAQALAAMNHPNIVGIYDFGQAGGFFYLLMEFVDGVNLRQAMKAGRFTPEQALAIVPPVCEALQFAHEHGIVHRDIKPENLLLDKDGRVKIADFGIAKMLGETSSVGFTESQPAGTPQYMAPEQKEHRRTDHRADIYSLGVVLYELLTGELPADKLQPPSQKVQIDVRLDEIVLRALQVKPELRFATAAEFRTQVETIAATPAERPRKETRSSDSPPRIFKFGTSTLATTAELATASGQFFCYRTLGQLILDDRQLTHSRSGETTIIPLAAIRDLSIGRYPRSMNPVGIEVLSLTYETAGEIRQVLISPIEGWFRLPASKVAEWFTAILDAVAAATGRAPTMTPADQLRMPRGSKAIYALFLALLVLASAALIFIANQPQTPGVRMPFPLNITPALWVVFALLVFVLLAAILFGRRRGGSGVPAGPVSGENTSQARFASTTAPRFGRLQVLAIVGLAMLGLFAGVAIWMTDRARRAEIASHIALRRAEALHAREIATLRLASKIPVIVSGRLLDQDHKPLGGKVLAFVKEDSVLITDGPTSDDGTFQFELPVDQPWHVVLLEDGKHGPRSEAMTTPTPGSSTSDVPDYDLELRLDGTRLQARLTPLSLEAMQGTETNTPQIIVASRLQLAALHKEVVDLRETLGPRHQKVLELLKRIEGLRTIIKQEGSPTAPAPPRGSTPMPEDGADAKQQHSKLPNNAYGRIGFPMDAVKLAMPPWGEAKDGLRIGIRVNGEAHLGGRVQVELWMQNIGSQDVKFQECGSADVDLAVVAKDSNGKDHAAKITSIRAYPVFRPYQLVPGHIFKVKEFTLRFDSEEDIHLPAQTARVHLPPGAYKLRVKWGDAKATNVNEGEWTGELTSGEVDLKIAAANASAKPPGDGEDTLTHPQPTQ